ncbi:MAG: ABC transporter substrate-binding protein [Trebonia sp.]
MTDGPGLISRRNLLRVAGLGAVAVPVLAACGSGGTSGATSDSKQSDLSGISLNVGQELSTATAGFAASGLFASAPYQIKYSLFQSPTDTLTALAASKVDISYNDAFWTATQAASAASPAYTASTAPYKAVLALGPGDPENNARFVIAASKQSGITDVTQAKGKRWGITPGSSLQLFADTVLAKLGWTDKDITVVSQNNTEYESELETGEVDISFATVDNISVALSRGARVIGIAYEYGLTIYVGILASTKALDNSLKNQAIEDYTRRMVQYQNWYNLNPGKAQAALVSGQELTAAQAKTSWTYARVLPTPVSSAVQAYSQKLATFGYQKGLLTSKVDIAALMDNRYASTVNAALKSTDYTANIKRSYS